MARIIPLIGIPLVSSVLWRNGEFKAFLAANTLSRFCASALSVLLGYQVYDLTHNPVYIGLLGLVEAVPGVTLVLYGGDVADRRSRRRIVYLSFMALALLSAVLAAASREGVDAAVPVIFAVAFLTAGIKSFESPAATGLEAQVLPVGQIMQGVPILASSARAADVVGPAVAGYVWAHLGASGTYAILATLLSMAALTVLMRVSEKPPVSSAAHHNEVWARIREGIQYVFGNQLLVGSMALDLFAVFFAGANALLPIMANEVLHVGPEGFGLLRSATAAGALCAAVLATRLLPMRHAGRVLHFVIAVFGLSIIVFALSRSFALSLAALFIAGLCDGSSMVIRHTILRLASPEALRGRIAAVKSVFVGSSNELGALQSGLTASAIGAAPALMVGGLVTLLVVVTVALRAPLLWNLDFRELARPNPPPDPEPATTPS